MLPQKLERIKHFKPPKNLRELKSFIGLVNSGKKFVKDYEILIHRLNKFNKEKLQWNPEYQRAFNDLKYAFINAPSLFYFDDSSSMVHFNESVEMRICTEITANGELWIILSLFYRNLRGSDRGNLRYVSN